MVMNNFYFSAMKTERKQACYQLIKTFGQFQVEANVSIFNMLQKN